MKSNIKRLHKSSFSFPTSKKEMEELSWEQADIILFSGDAFIDHPAFGTAIIARILESAGYKVAIIPQPNWRDDLRDFKKLGSPKLMFGVTSGNMDSMVNHYTANKRLRSTDAYTPGNKAGYRPDYAVSVYSRILKSLYPEIPLVIGGIEASLRRLTHYDYWSDSLKPSILIDSGADLLLYGMAEHSIIEVAKRLENSEKIGSIRDVPQTAFRTDSVTFDDRSIVVLASFEDCLKSKRAFARNIVLIEEESNQIIQRRILEQVNNQWIVVNPSYPPMSEAEIDGIYDLPYTRLPHPRYNKKELIPAFEMIKDSVTIHRGCFGGCSFCTISAHQGKFISSRSKNSILKELKKICNNPDFKGHITDLGGPSANMYMMKGLDEKQCEHCKRPSCIYPRVCRNLDTNAMPLIELYREARSIKGIKKVTIGSGIRYDLIIDPRNRPINASSLDYLEELVVHHVSGRLKVAPEHTSQKVLKSMRKPSFDTFLHLHRRFDEICRIHGIKEQLVPYFISSLPESELEDMADAALQIEKLGLHLEQVQDLTPTPLTLASVMFYTGLDPYKMEKISIPRSIDEKKIQQLFFFLYQKEKRIKLKSELLKMKRYDIIRQLHL
jgi:uncharacterized radical SAM protein YgiQ